MKTTKKADHPEQAEEATTIIPPPKAVAGLNPPKGEELDGGDVDEVIKLDPLEHINVVYRGYKETKGKKPGQVNRLHKFIMEDGVARGMWGTMTLDGMLAKCKVGDTLWIAYVGKDDLPNGNTMHNWRVVRTAKVDG